MVQKGTNTAVQKTQNMAQPPPNYEKISQDPLKFVTTFIEKKIRNLDKRKVTLIAIIRYDFWKLYNWIIYYGSMVAISFL